MVRTRKGFCSVGRRSHHAALTRLCDFTWKRPFKNSIPNANAIAEHLVAYEILKRIFCKAVSVRSDRLWSGPLFSPVQPAWHFFYEV